MEIREDGEREEESLCLLPAAPMAMAQRPPRKGGLHSSQANKPSEHYVIRATHRGRRLAPHHDRVQGPCIGGKLKTDNECVVTLEQNDITKSFIIHTG